MLDKADVLDKAKNEFQEAVAHLAKKVTVYPYLMLFVTITIVEDKIKRSF